MKLRPSRKIIYSSNIFFLALTCWLPLPAQAEKRPPASSLDMARLAEAAYNPNKKFIPTNGFKRIRGDSSITGLKYAVYERENNGVKERVLAFAGTDGITAINDLATDFLQAVTGFSFQYEQAIHVAAKEIRAAKRDGAVVTFTGHSLGGGLAQNASAQFNVPATVFEPAGLGLINSLSLELQDLIGLIETDPDDAPVTNIQMDNDPVPWWGDQLGEEYELDHDGWISHGIGDVITLLEAKGLVDTWWDTNLNQASNFNSLIEGEQKILRDLLAASSLDKLEKYESVIDAQFDNLQRFQVGAFRNTTPFVFSTPTSTGGFVDVTIPTTTNFIFNVLDTAVEDGDRIQINLASGSGQINFGSVTLTNAGQTLPAQPVAAGPVEVRIRALNEGDLSPNTGGLRILSPVLSGPKSQDFNLNQGETGTLRVIAE